MARFLLCLYSMVFVTEEDTLQEECRLLPDGHCLHCGLACAGQFCCQGCQTIHQTLTKLGLTEYYRWRLPREKPVDHAPAQLFADLEAIEPVLSLEGHATHTFQIAGIYCAGCVWLLERLAEIQSGIKKSELHFSTGRLTVIFNPQQISLSAVARLLDQLGYPPQTTPPTSIDENASKKELLKIGVAAFCSMNTMLLAVSLFEGFFTGIQSDIADMFRWLSLAIALPSVGWCALPIYSKAFRALLQKRIHIELPLVVAILAAFLLSVANTIFSRPYVYFDSVCLLIFLLLAARRIQHRAIEKAQHEARLGWALLPSTARKKHNDVHISVPIDELIVGDAIIVAPAERFPTDGIITEGNSSVDLSILTGESAPPAITVGSKVPAGAMNLSGPVTVVISAIGEHSRIGKILHTLRSSDTHKGSLTKFTDAVGKWYIRILGIAAVVTIVLDPTMHGLESLLTLLTVTCPCALAFAVPTIYGCAIGDASQQGMLIKSSGVLEDLPSARTAYTDKTGTLTVGKLQLSDQKWIVKNEEAFTTLARLTSLVPTHPVSAALRSHFHFQNLYTTDAVYIPGCGIELTQGDKVWRLGKPAWASSAFLSFSNDSLQTTVILGCNGQPVAQFFLSDELRSDARNVIGHLHRKGIKVCVLSGDRSETVKEFALQCGINPKHCYGSLTPQEKAAIVSSDKHTTLFIGDGVNDSLALKEAAIGIAFATGLETTVEPADVVITNDRLASVTTLLTGAERMKQVVVTILGISILYNICAGTAAVLGYMNPLVAAFLMPTSSTIAILCSVVYRPFKE